MCSWPSESMHKLREYIYVGMSPCRGGVVVGRKMGIMLSVISEMVFHGYERKCGNFIFRTFSLSLLAASRLEIQLLCTQGRIQILCP